MHTAVHSGGAAGCTAEAAADFCGELFYGVSGTSKLHHGMSDWHDRMEVFADPCGAGVSP